MLVDTPDGKFLSKCMLLLCSVDLPARALVCNMKQFSGEYGCCTCLDKGDNTTTGSPPHRIWPYSSANIRSKDDVKRAFKVATETTIAVSQSDTQCIFIFYLVFYK